MPSSPAADAIPATTWRYQKSTSSLTTLLLTLSWAVSPIAFGEIQILPSDCVPAPGNGNAVITATVDELAIGSWPRLYFRNAEDTHYYYVPMHASSEGHFWGVLPKPKPKLLTIEYYVANVTPLGQEEDASPLDRLNISKDCEVPMTARQFSASENIIIGETNHHQIGKKVQGFLCQGIVLRVDWRGVMRYDNVCNRLNSSNWGRAVLIRPDEEESASPTDP